MASGGRRSVVSIGVLAAALAGCSAESGPKIDHHTAEEPRLAESEAARTRVASLRERFKVARQAPEVGAPVHVRRERSVGSMPVIGGGVVERFEPVDGGRLRAVVGARARRGVSKTARVELPVKASGPVRVEDETSHMAITFALEGARDVEIAVSEGIGVYVGALPGGGDVVHRVHAEGTEDYVLFEQRPDREELRYQVDVSGVAGLRLVSNVLEFLDEQGAPRLRVAPPYVVDAVGRMQEAQIGVDGCAYDADPRAPWGRAGTAPRAKACILSVAWADVIYPIVTDPQWTSTGSLSTARDTHAAVTLSALSGGMVLVAGGGNTGALASAELYNPTSGTWAQTGYLNSARLRPAAALLTTVPGDKVLITGGHDTSTFATCEIYAPQSGTWSPVANMSTARSGHTATALADGTVLVVGGAGNLTAETYDPTMNQWSLTGDVGESRSNHITVRLSNGKVLAAGGNGSSSAELYDPTIGTWKYTGGMNSARTNHAGAPLPNNGALAVGGYDDQLNVLSSADRYDFATGTWSTAGSLSTGREGHTASALPNGKVAVAGGRQKGPPYLASADLYDPASGSWGSAGTMALGHAYHTASVLLNGTVLIAGGIGPTPLPQAELYLIETGFKCASASDCQSGFCTDSVCCNTACNAGPCNACSVAAGALTDGTCALLSGPACDDGNACTQTDTCQSGVCTGTNPITCTAQDTCHDPGTCNSSTGTCSTPAKQDGSPCTGGICQSGACMPTPDGGADAGDGGEGGSGTTSASSSSGSTSSTTSTSASGSSTNASGSSMSTSGSAGSGGAGGSPATTTNYYACATAPGPRPAAPLALAALAGLLGLGVRRRRRPSRHRAVLPWSIDQL